MASPYCSGRSHSPATIIFAPWTWCQSWSGVRCTGSMGCPASAPSETGVSGGRAVVVPVWGMVQPLARAQRWSAFWLHILPWHGPMEMVL